MAEEEKSPKQGLDIATVVTVTSSQGTTDTTIDQDMATITYPATLQHNLWTLKAGGI